NPMRVQWLPFSRPKRKFRLNRESLEEPMPILRIVAWTREWKRGTVRTLRGVVAIVAAVVIAATFPGLLAAPNEEEHGFPGEKDRPVQMPDSTNESPRDVGIRAHTNHLIVVRPDRAEQSGSRIPAGETPGSLACVDQISSPSSSSGCPITGNLANGNSGLPTPSGGSQTIAVVEAYDYPTAYNDDVTVFSKQFLAHAARAGESLVYAVSTSEMTQSQVLSKTESFIVDSETGKQRLVFSDAAAEFLLLPGNDVQSDIVAAGGRIFSRGVERKLYTNRRSDYPAAVFELPTSRSGKARKIFDIENEGGIGSNFRNLFISPTGAKIGYMKVSNGKPCLFLHETSTGKLLRKLDLSHIVFDLFVTAISWMPDGERLFF